MDELEAVVEVEKVVKREFLPRVAIIHKRPHSRRHFLGRGGRSVAHGVRQALVGAYGKPLLPRVCGAVFQGAVELLHESFRKLARSVFDDHIHALEMVGGLYDVVGAHRTVRDADSVGLKDVSRLIVRELAPFHVVGIVGELDLHRVIDPA